MIYEALASGFRKPPLAYPNSDLVTAFLFRALSRSLPLSIFQTLYRTCDWRIGCLAAVFHGSVVFFVCWISLRKILT